MSGVTALQHSINSCVFSSRRRTRRQMHILPEDLDTLTSQMSASPCGQSRTHYGLYNVNRRIRNKYGTQCGLSIQSEVGEFTRVFVTVPIKKEAIQ